MKIATLAAAATLTLGAGAVALPAFADDDDMSPARMQRLDDRASAKGYSVTREQAMDIARSKGMSRIQEIDLDSDDNDNDHEWKLEGRTADGKEIEIEISARDGAINELEIDK